MYFQNVSPIRSETVALSVHAQLKNSASTCSTLDSSPISGHPHAAISRNTFCEWVTFAQPLASTAFFLFREMGIPKQAHVH